MKGKILRIFLAFVVTIPMFTSVLAISSEDLLARLDAIAVDINAMKEEYNQIISTYPDVINSLSAETKAAAETLVDNLMADEIVNTVQTIKAELAASTVTDADKVLAAIEDLQADASELIEDNKDIVEDVKSGYSDLTVEEIQEVVEKAVEIVKSLGANADVSDTYDDMMTVLNEAHGIATEITVKLEPIIENNVGTFESALSMDLVKGLLSAIENKDEGAVIDTLIEALNNAEGGAALKEDLKEVKDLVIDLKDKIMELDTLSEQDLLMFTDDQKADVAQIVKDVEEEYIEFAKIILDNYATDYVQVIIDAAYNKTVDQMINYANIALDYYEKYEDTIKSLSVSSIVAKLPQDLVQKAGIMVALGFVDMPEFNRNYITNNFGDQIDSMIQYLADEMVAYLDHIEETINDEVMDVYQNGVESEATQNELRTITVARFTTLSNIKALKNRVDTELLSNHQGIKEDLDQLVMFVYHMYEGNIVSSIGATLVKENDDSAKKYETLDDECILTNTFFALSDFTNELGIPSSNKGVVSYTNTAGSKIKTGTTFNIGMEFVRVSATFAVLGDIYADGEIDARDYMMIKNHIMEYKEMSGINLTAADTYRDDSIDARDYMMIKNYIMDGTDISL